MNLATWQLQTPIDALIFDCDGTLSSLEGIDELAKENGVLDPVKTLTADAMGKSGLNVALYQKRLDLVRPREEQMLELGKAYCDHTTADAKDVIRHLKLLGKTIYIVSAGLYPSVAFFGEQLQVPRSTIFAVDIQFNPQGHYQDFDHSSPLVACQGKRVIVTALKKQHPKIIFVGDGLNDYETHDLCQRFIGYGGSYYRENIAALCQFYIKTASMAPLLPLSLTQEEQQKLTREGKTLLQKGLNALEEGQVILR